MTHTLRYAARTDRGLLRANNQDSVFAGNRMLVVADGMGGHVAGDTASRLAVAAFAPLDDYDPKGRDLLTPLEHATEDGNEAIADMVTADPDLDGMGTTVTALMFDGGRLGIAHVGDSRAYLWRGGVLSQITHDDTFVQSLIDEGRITEAEAAHHPQRSLLLHALNGGDIEPTLSQREVRVGDRYLICSDGLSGVVSAEAIADTLASYETAEAADRLIELALRGGGPDNVTVIVADVLDTGEAAVLDDEPLHDLDTDATGPIAEMRFTKRMPRVALPKEPDVTELAARADAAQPAQAARPPRYADPITTPIEMDEDGDPGDGDLEDDDLEDDDLEDTVLLTSPSSPARKWARRAAYLVGVVALLILGGVLGVNWVGNQYYVGDNDGAVTVYRGVDGSVLGVDLSSAQEGSCMGQPATCQALHTNDLVPAARDQVLAGIPASDLQNAREIIARLNAQVLPPCSTFQPPPPPTSTSTRAASIESSPSITAGSVTAPASASGFAKPTETLGANTFGRGTGAPDTSVSQTGSTVDSRTTPPATTLSADSAVPGINCRTGT